jgi:hypothetical protein
MGIVAGKVVPCQMTSGRFKVVCDEIRAMTPRLGDLLIELHDTNGWIRGGYRSFRQCLKYEFTMSRSGLYNVMDARRVELELENFKKLSKCLDKRAFDLPTLTQQCYLLLYPVEGVEKKVECLRRAQQISRNREFDGEAARFHKGRFRKTNLETAIREIAPEAIKPKPQVEPKKPKGSTGEWWIDSGTVYIKRDGVISSILWDDLLAMKEK